MKTNQSNKIQKLLLSTVIGITALVFTNCKKANEIQPESVSKTEVVSLGNEVMATSITAIPLGSYDVANALPSGYVTDGSVDYTAYLQSALDKNLNLTFPGFPLLVNDTGLFINSNRTITFLDGSEIRLKASSKNGYMILRIGEATNVTLINPVVKGDRNTHIGITGEAGVGIGIRGSSNVTLISPVVRECWGDGIYIGQARNVINSVNITIKGAFLKRNRRAGMSIISVDGLKMDNIYAGYSDGVLPMCGINFEPNNPGCTIKNIVVNNVKTVSNLGQGIQFGLRELVGGGDRFIDATINNHRDFGSNIGFKCSAIPTEGTTGGQIVGLVKVTGAAWDSNTLVPMVFSTNQPKFDLTISNVAVTNFRSTIWTYENLTTLFNRYVGATCLGKFTFLR